jgi:hypothetical protein
VQSQPDSLSKQYCVKWIFGILRGFARFFRSLQLVPENLSQPRDLLLKPLDAVNFMVNHCTEESEGALVHSASLHLRTLDQTFSSEFSQQSTGGLQFLVRKTKSSGLKTRIA